MSFPFRALMLSHIRVQLTLGSVFVAVIALPAAALASLFR